MLSQRPEVFFIQVAIKFLEEEMNALIADINAIKEEEKRENLDENKRNDLERLRKSLVRRLSEVEITASNYGLITGSHSAFYHKLQTYLAERIALQESLIKETKEKLEHNKQEIEKHSIAPELHLSEQRLKLKKMEQELEVYKVDLEDFIGFQNKENELAAHYAAKVRSQHHALETDIEDQIKKINHELVWVHTAQLAAYFEKLDEDRRKVLFTYHANLINYMKEQSLEIFRMTQSVRPSEEKRVLDNHQFEEDVKRRERLNEIFSIFEKALENLNEDELEVFAQGSSERVKFLLKKKKFLEEKQKSMKDHAAEVGEEAEELSSPGRVLFDIGKKFVDLIDDAWGATKAVIPVRIVELVGPFLVSITGLIIHLGEMYTAVKEAFHDIRALLNKEKVEQGKTKIVTNIIAALFAATGTGLATAYVAGAAGIAISGFGLMPVLIPAFLTGIYTLMLGRRSYVLHRAIEEDVEAEKDYQKSLKKLVDDYQNDFDAIKNDKSDLRKEYSNIQAKHELLRVKINFTDKKIVDKVKNNEPLTEDEQRTYTALQTEMADINRLSIAYNEKLNALKTKEAELIKTTTPLQGEIEKKKQLAHHRHEARIKAERELAFSTFEVTGSILTVVGTVLTTAAFVALFTTASIASFGAVPVAILVLGFAIGVGAKIFEKIDEKKGHKPTRWLRDKFANLFNKIRGKKDPQDVQMAEVPVMTPPAAPAVNMAALPALQPAQPQFVAAPGPAVGQVLAQTSEEELDEKLKARRSKSDEELSRLHNSTSSSSSRSSSPDPMDDKSSISNGTPSVSNHKATMYGNNPKDGSENTKQTVQDTRVKITVKDDGKKESFLRNTFGK